MFANSAHQINSNSGVQSLIITFKDIEGVHISYFTCLVIGPGFVFEILTQTEVKKRWFDYTHHRVIRFNSP